MKNKTEINPHVFVHVYPIIEPDLDCRTVRDATIVPKLNVIIYRIEESAEIARSYLGGMVIPTTADNLKGRVQQEVLATAGDEILEEIEGDAPIDEELPMASLIFGYDDSDGDIPHTVEKDKHGNTTGWRFKGEHRKWVDAFFDQSGLQFTM
jgi:hypothetical protein